MDVRGSGAEAQEREEIESEGEESEGNVSDDSGPRSLSLSSESEDSQKGAPLVRARGCRGGHPRKKGPEGTQRAAVGNQDQRPHQSAVGGRSPRHRDQAAHCQWEDMSQDWPRLHRGARKRSRGRLKAGRARQVQMYRRAAQLAARIGSQVPKPAEKRGRSQGVSVRRIQEGRDPGG
ncbi:Hypothetical predicted protein [Podarcis lilfordi]|uniref:Uncharacterized protein n=1 Tax=Podarcis lilfordi TaxID=74358 RepID=A0AA35KYW1_9SAUR|nr:Hypothetical predicted protein [Podarcis lilfordi]